jgi:choline dehydrogenase-like flavoprotein
MISVVDSQFRVHGYENLFICDAVFPTTIHVTNPQLTIMALADYFGHLGVL